MFSNYQLKQTAHLTVNVSFVSSIIILLSANTGSRSKNVLSVTTLIFHDKRPGEQYFLKHETKDGGMTNCTPVGRLTLAHYIILRKHVSTYLINKVIEIPFILKRQQYSCWWFDDAKGQCINNYGVDLEYSDADTTQINYLQIDNYFVTQIWLLFYHQNASIGWG